MMSILSALFRRWTWIMAWRESRMRRRRLMLLGSSMVFGIAALVAIGSFRDAVERSIQLQAKSLLGADLVLAGRARFGAAEEALFQSIPGRRAREADFSSMVLFPSSGGTRLVQVRALEGEFPFYGRLESEPDGSLEQWRREGGALVEELLLDQFSAKVGDTVKVGDLNLVIRGRLRRVPGDSMLFATLAPRVYVRAADVAASPLLREGSLARYKAYFQLPPDQSAESLVERLKPRLDELRLGHTTVERKKEDLGDSLQNLSNFLSLVGFVALFLGSVGVGSAIQTHVREKLSDVAVLRCLGTSSSQTFAVFLAQAMGLGCMASLAGVILGVVIQWMLPSVLGDFIAVPLAFSLSPWGIAQGLGIGFVCCTLFTLLPLLPIRRVSPLMALRAAYGISGMQTGRLERLVVGILILGVTTAFAAAHMNRPVQGVYFSVGLVAALGILGMMARGLMAFSRRTRPAFLSYAWRQGLANLHRPNNRTALLIVAAGLGTFLLVTLYLVQDSMLKQLASSSSKEGPNTVFFDIQPDQREGVIRLLSAKGLPVMDATPIVTMRLSKVKDRTVESLLGDSNRTVAKWALRREYRSTWRTNLQDSETLISGVWHPPISTGSEITPVSVEEGIAKELGLRLGDEVTFDVQGVPLTTRVASLRRVDWRRVQPNFFVVFPPGVLESAPVFYVVVTRTSSSAESAGLQRAMVESFPNVSAIDLTLVLGTLDAVFQKIGFAIRFMALFTVATGLLVLAGTVMVSRHQRLREIILLRTLGASRGQVRQIFFAEYVSLGLLSGLSGAVLATGAAWALSRWVFQAPFHPSWGTVAGSVVVVTLLTLVTGWISGRGVLDHPPLEVLREESM